MLGRTLALCNKRSKSAQWNVMDKLTQTHRWCEAYKSKFGENVRGALRAHSVRVTRAESSYSKGL